MVMMTQSRQRADTHFAAGRARRGLWHLLLCPRCSARSCGFIWKRCSSCLLDYFFFSLRFHVSPCHLELLRSFVPALSSVTCRGWEGNAASSSCGGYLQVPEESRLHCARVVMQRILGVSCSSSACPSLKRHSRAGAALGGLLGALVPKPVLAEPP